MPKAETKNGTKLMKLIAVIFLLCFQTANVAVLSYLYKNIRYCQLITFDAEASGSSLSSQKAVDICLPLGQWQVHAGRFFP